MLQLTSLRFAALIVVQPIGAIALVVTAILNARMNHIHLSRKVDPRDRPVRRRGRDLRLGRRAERDGQRRSATTTCARSSLLLLVVLVVIGTLYAIFRARMTPIAYVIGAGILYGFVATMAKTVINRLDRRASSTG